MRMSEKCCNYIKHNNKSDNSLTSRPTDGGKNSNSLNKFFVLDVLNSFNMAPVYYMGKPNENKE